MKAATGIGIAIATVGLLAGAVMEGTSPVSFFNVPALIIIVAGTSGATIAAVGLERFLLIPGLYRRVLSAEPPDAAGQVELLVGLAERARREGLLALDGGLEEIDDAFVRSGLQLVVDGTDPEVVRDVLEGEVIAMEARHRAGANVFKQAGGFAPTMGIIGTVMGLVHVLQNLSAPETLGPSISGAFIATLIGVGTANVVYLPVANRLAELSREEAAMREVTIEGILAIQAGDNPRIVREKLLAAVPPAERAAVGDGAPAPAAVGAAPVTGRDERFAEAA